jgi:hypothetical protein
MKLKTLLGLGLLMSSVYAHAAGPANYVEICNTSSYPYSIVNSGVLPNPDGTPSAQCINFSSGVIQTPTASGTIVTYESTLAARVSALETKLAQLRTQLGLPQERVNK